ncbi:MAG TPA: VanZ family protein [Solirubrobacteraceae bacterium]|nr:VanZ family protein [Solirubrobacteraceae bacterium]
MRLVSRYGPPLLLMGLVFFLSGQPGLKSGLGVADLILRKLVHAGTFGLLFVLWLRALGWRAPGWAAAISFLYAASDEYHQHFIPDRVGSPIDVAIDTLGIALAWWLWRRLDPAALGGDEDRLGAVDGAELPVDVVQVGADGAGRERQL